MGSAISLPDVLNAMFTWVSSMLPERVILLGSLRLQGPHEAMHAQPEAISARTGRRLLLFRVIITHSY
jgi:hypothetical protein